MGISAGSGSRIKSIQAVTVNVLSGQLSATATIAAVNTSRTVIQPAGSAGVDTGLDKGSSRLSLVSATQVSATRGQGASSNNLDVNAFVIEYE